MKTNLTLIAFSLLFNISLQASEGLLKISTNQRIGDSEHISNVGVYINNQLLQTGSPLNTIGNDSSGTISFPLSFDNDANSKLVLTIDKNTSGHKVLAGMKLVLVSSDNSTTLLGTTFGEPFNENSFGFSEKIDFESSVQLQSGVLSTSSPINTYYRNALNVCIRQAISTQVLGSQLTVGGKKFLKTTTVNIPVGREVVDVLAGINGLGGCRK